MLNDYDTLAETYSRSHKKPDKQYSILPTVLDICRNRRTLADTIFDIGCGDGFFTFPIAEQYPEANVFGIDNSQRQIELATDILRGLDHHHITFVQEDVFQNGIWCDSQLVLTPFILGYKQLKELTKFFTNIYQNLTEGGVLVIVLDDVSGVDNSKYGAKKTYNGGNIDIELFDKDGQYITTLHAIFHHKEHIISLLQEIGFRDIQEHAPIISNEGMEAYGAEFWNGYKENPELCYISCIK